MGSLAILFLHVCLDSLDYDNTRSSRLHTVCTTNRNGVVLVTGRKDGGWCRPSPAMQCQAASANHVPAASEEGGAYCWRQPRRVLYQTDTERVRVLEEKWASQPTWSRTRLCSDCSRAPTFLLFCIFFLSSLHHSFYPLSLLLLLFSTPPCIISALTVSTACSLLCPTLHLPSSPLPFWSPFCFGF